MKLGKLEIDLKELGEFIVKAKKSCYAGEGIEERAKDGSKILTYQEGNFHYTDNYDGFYQAPGTEIVRWQNPEGQRIWQMSYSGGMTLEYQKDKEFAKATFGFLKKVLSQVDIKNPFRGPANFKEKPWSYFSSYVGTLANFAGEEMISNDIIKQIVFKQDFIGGLIIPK